MSLANCLLKHAKLLNGLDTSSIREAADEYVASGMSKIEAERKATDDKLAELAFDRARVEREILAQYKEMNPTAFALETQSPAELQAKKDAEEKNAKDKAEADRKAAEAESKAQERETVKQRSEGAAADFRLGQSAMDNLSGQRGLAFEQNRAQYPTNEESQSTLLREQRDRALRAEQSAKEYPGGSRARLRPLALGIARDFERHGAAALVGQQVRSAEDLATLAQLYRDPRYETFRYFFTKGDEIVASGGISSRLPGRTGVFPTGMKEGEGIAWIKAQMASAGADGYWILHNHPSGNPRPSRSDITLTKALASSVDGMRGHVVINSNKYAFISPVDGGETVIEKQFGKDELLTASMPSAHLGKTVSGPNQVATVGKSFERPGWVTLIGQSGVAGVRAISEFPAKAFANEGMAKAAVRRFGRTTGSDSVFVYAERSAVNQKAIKELIVDNYIVDAVYEDGKSARENYNPRGNQMSFGYTERGDIVAQDGLFSRKVADEKRIADLERDQPLQLQGQDNSAARIEREKKAAQGPLFDRKAADQTNTPEFRAWFKDSKVVDADGNPLVVYHQTSKDKRDGIFNNGGFSTTPELARARLSDEQVPNGIFFKPEPNDIGVGAVENADKTQIPVYLSLQNPLVVADRDALANWLERNSDDYRAAAFDVKEVDAKYKPVFDEAFNSKDYDPDKVDGILKDWLRDQEAAAAKSRSVIDKLLVARGYDGLIIENDAGSLKRKTKSFVVLKGTQVKSADQNNGNFDQNDNRIQYSRGRPQQSILPTDARAATDVITKKWKNAPKITVHESLTSDSVPEGLRTAMEKEGVTDARGAWYAGGIELFPSNIGSLAELERTIVHEARHYGLEGLFGKDMNPILMEIYMKDKGVRTEANRLAKTLKLSTVDAVNETLANMDLDAAKKLPAWKKLVAKLKAWLNDHGFTNLAKMLEGPSADEITKDILFQIEDFVKTGKRGDTTFTTTLFHRAFHGSPHDHDGFSLDKIGTGEGAQAYGWGLYFAGKQQVAEYYKNALSKNIRAHNTFDGKRISAGMVRDLKAQYAEGTPIGAALRDLGALKLDGSSNAKDMLLKFADAQQGYADKNRQRAAELSDPEIVASTYTEDDMLRRADYYQRKADGYRELASRLGYVEQAKSGKLYEVELAPKQEDYLDWDKPLSEQPEVMKRLNLRVVDDSTNRFDPVFTLETNVTTENGNRFRYPVAYDFKSRADAERAMQTLTGQRVYQYLSRNGPENDGYSETAKEASRFLKSIGIPGIRYLDGSSRSKGEGNSNFVIFDDKDVSIVAKYSRTAADAPKRWDAPEPSKMDSILYKLQDKQIDLRRVIEAVKDGIGDIQDTWNAYLKEEMFHGRSAKRVADFARNELKPLLTDMQMRGVTIPELETYLHNRHAEERNKQVAKINPKLPDRGSGITTKDARAYLAGLAPEQKAKYEALAKKVDAITKGTRQTLQDYGLMSNAEMRQWEGAYKHYVPLMKDTEVTGQGEGFSIRGDESKRAMGDGAIDSNILANLMAQRERAIVRGEKNRVALSLYGLAKLNPNPDFWTVDTPPIVRRIVKLSDKADRRTIPLGMDIPENATEVVVEGKDPMFLSRENVIVTKYYNPKTDEVTEKAIVFNEDDPRAVRMAAALKNLDADQMGEIMNTMAKATRFLASVNTQYNPIFGLVNLTRDVQGAALNLSSTPLAGKQKQVLGKTLKALAAVYLTERNTRKGREPSGEWAKLYEDFQNTGAQTGYRDLFTSSQDRADALQSEIDKITEGKAKKAGRAVFDWLSDYNQAMENSVRLAAYKVGLDQGMSKEQAASVAKNLTVNFNRKGQITQQAGALYAFFNASVQGTARLAQTLSGPAGRKIIIGGLIIGALQAMMLAGFDEDEPPQFERERNLIIPIGGKSYVKIPMPLGLHVIPNISRILIEMGLHGKPMDRLFQLMSVTVDAFNPVGAVGLSAQTFTPTVADPFVALGENRDWTGKPIAREDLSSLNPTPGHTRAKDTATWHAKVLSEGLNWLSGGTEYTKGKISPTPDQLDYLIGQVTGGVGREASKIQQSISAGFTGEELPPYKIPVLGRFYGSTGSQASKAALFYRNLKQLNAHEAEIEGRQKNGQDPSDYIRDNPDSELYEAANQVERQISKMMKAKRQLVKDGADRSDVKDIEEAMTDIMGAFNETVAERRGK